MILRLLLSLFITTSIYAKETSWYEDIASGTYVKLEAGLHMSNMDGTISNATSTADYKDDLGYTNTTASFFSVDFRFDYEYLPNIEISHFNMKQNRDSKLDSSIQAARTNFDNNVSSRIDYQVLNMVMYKSFQRKGKREKILKWRFYPGDIEFNLGVNVKYIDHLFEIRNSADITSEYKFVRVNMFIPQPYTGFKYYYYDIIIYGHISALSFSRAKAMNYEVGIDYKLMQGLYFSYSYMYEDFQATEILDSVDFQAAGNKFSVKYAF